VRINISVRHGQLSEATRGRPQAKLDKLDRIFERLTAIDLTVDLEHSDAPSVELRVSAEHKHDFVATEQAEGLMAAVDGVVHKLEQQLRKYKEKVQDHHRTRVPRSDAGSTESEAASD
jgi:putative sigma-54 modulation protein